MHSEKSELKINEKKDDSMRLLFRAWHAKRAAEIMKRADDLTIESIKDGFSNSPATRRASLFKSVGERDDDGFEAWMAGASAQQELPVNFLQIQQSLLKSYGVKALNCIAELSKLTGQSFNDDLTDEIKEEKPKKRKMKYEF